MVVEKWDGGDINMVVGKWDGGDMNMVVGKVGWRGHEYSCGESRMEGT